jgi:hypothetical protein
MLVLTPRPGRFTRGEGTRYPFYRRLGGSQGPSGRVRKISIAPGLEPGPSSPERVAISTIPCNVCKLKVWVNLPQYLIQGHTLCGNIGTAPFILTIGTRWRWVVCFTLRWSRGKAFCNLWIGVWVGFRAVLDGLEKRNHLPVPWIRTKIPQSSSISFCVRWQNHKVNPCNSST